MYRLLKCSHWLWHHFGIGILSAGLLCLAACSEVANDPVLDVSSVSFAPDVPPPIARDEPAHIVINLKIEEKVMDLSDGIQYEFWTYNGQVPGPFIRIRQDDTFEVHLDNAKGTVTHSVDFHAVTGTGGGAAVLMANPGETRIATFKALNPGFFVYHCAAPPVPVHIANGLYGAILVEPRGGLPKVDREFFVMQSEFYTGGELGETGLQSYSSSKAMAETPEYVVFNGHTESLIGENALKAKVGESVRLYVGNIGPNLVSSFHVIGEIFDRVYREGTLLDFERNVQTTMIPSGSASVVEFELQVPGTYTLLDHSIFRIQRGALGELVVEGPNAPEIYRSGPEADTSQ